MNVGKAGLDLRELQSCADMCSEDCLGRRSYVNFKVLYVLIECHVVGFIVRGYSIGSQALYKLVQTKIEAAKLSKQ